MQDYYYYYYYYMSISSMTQSHYDSCQCNEVIMIRHNLMEQICYNQISLNSIKQSHYA